LATFIGLKINLILVIRILAKYHIGKDTHAVSRSFDAIQLGGHLHCSDESCLVCDAIEGFELYHIQACKWKQTVNWQFL